MTSCVRLHLSWYVVHCRNIWRHTSYLDCITVSLSFACIIRKLIPTVIQILSRTYHVQYQDKWHSLELLPRIPYVCAPKLGPEIQKDACAVLLTGKLHFIVQNFKKIVLLSGNIFMKIKPKKSTITMLILLDHSNIYITTSNPSRDVDVGPGVSVLWSPK
jgi:hypothetical protein